MKVYLQELEGGKADKRTYIINTFQLLKNVIKLRVFCTPIYIPVFKFREKYKMQILGCERFSKL